MPRPIRDVIKNLIKMMAAAGSAEQAVRIWPKMVTNSGYTSAELRAELESAIEDYGFGSDITTDEWHKFADNMDKVPALQKLAMKRVQPAAQVGEAVDGFGLPVIY